MRTMTAVVLRSRHSQAARFFSVQKELFILSSSVLSADELTLGTLEAALARSKILIRDSVKAQHAKHAAVIANKDIKGSVGMRNETSGAHSFAYSQASDQS